MAETEKKLPKDGSTLEYSVNTSITLNIVDLVENNKLHKSKIIMSLLNTMELRELIDIQEEISKIMRDKYNELDEY